MASAVEKRLNLAEARETGATRYFTGRPCKYGHVAERMVSNRKCLRCLREQKKEWNSKHVEHRRVQKKEWDKENRWRERDRYWKDPAAGREKCRRHRALAPERYKAYFKKSELKNAASLKAARKQWRLDNIEKVREKGRIRKRRDKAKYRILENNRRARILGNGGKFTQADIDAINKRQGYKCPHCSASTQEKYHIDHRIPISKGGTNDPRNIDILCPSCNMKKNAKHPVDFARENGRLL